MDATSFLYPLGSQSPRISKELSVDEARGLMVPVSPHTRYENNIKGYVTGRGEVNQPRNGPTCAVRVRKVIHGTGPPYDIYKPVLKEDCM